ALHGSSAPPRSSRRRWMLLAATALVVGSVAATLGAVFAVRDTPSAVRTRLFITPRGFVNAPLGLKDNDYKSIFGIGWREDKFVPPQFPVLYYFDRGFGIYFNHPGGKAIIMTTWNKHYRTAAGVG